jgi:alpha-tubulin suppressor-like RCC1 family protein
MRRYKENGKVKRFVLYFLGFALILTLFVIFGLYSLVGCSKKQNQGNEKSGGEKKLEEIGTKFESPSDAAGKTFGSFSAGAVESNIITARIITARVIEEGPITGRAIEAGPITARIITARIITARAPKFGALNDEDLNFVANQKRISEKQNLGELEISCEDIKPRCLDGKAEKTDCSIEQISSGKRLNFDIKVSDCKEDAGGGNFIVSTGYAKGYLEFSTKVSEKDFEQKFVFSIQEGESTMRELKGDTEVRRVKIKAVEYKNEFTISRISDVGVIRVVVGVSGLYSKEDLLTKRKEEYLYSDFEIEVVGRYQEEQFISTSLPVYLSIRGGYSVDTEPASCAEGGFIFRTINPIKQEISAGVSPEASLCISSSGEIEVNNAKIEFSGSTVKFSVENQKMESLCEEVLKMCVYEPILVAEGVELGGESRECQVVWYKDLDKDGYTDGTTRVSCYQPFGYVLLASQGDCKDNDPSINPAKEEICDGKDNDCDGQIDEGAVCEILFAKMPKIKAGGTHTCALKKDGSLWCWGNNYSGQLGDGTNQDRLVAVQVISSGVLQVSLGLQHTCAVKKDGSLWCWGRNEYGQLGDGTNTNRNKPVQIIQSGVASVSCGRHHTCVIKTDGSLWCWGWNEFGQLGVGTVGGSILTPTKVMSAGVSSVSLGYAHTCAVKQDGSLWCWGYNRDKQLGDGTNINRPSPRKVLEEVLAVSLGGDHTCAIKQNGSLWCWGKNAEGQLGNGASGESVATPVQIMPSGVSSISLGGEHTCEVKQDGSLWCWGKNDSGQLGDGTTTSKNSPVKIIQSDVVSVSLGYAFTCAEKTDGSLWCWGDNFYGQLGDGTTANRNTPTRVIEPGE